MILSFVLVYLCSVVHAIRYSVITSADKVGVLVDGKYYPLSPTRRQSILFRGDAPAAQYNYTYIETTGHHSKRESFHRSPVLVDTFNEFFNRSWHQALIKPLPQIYPQLPSMYPTRAKEEGGEAYQIPTIHFEASASKIAKLHHNPLINEQEIKVHMTYIELEQEQQFKGVKLELSGRSSRKMAKLSYKFKLHHKDRLYGYREFKLRSLYLDPSYLREQTGSDFVDAMGLAGSRFSYVRVFINGKPIGLFGLIETFEAPWSAHTFAEKQQGSLYEGKRNEVLADLGYYGNTEAYHRGQYSLKQKGTSSHLQPLIGLTQFINKKSRSVLEWNRWLDVDSFLRSMALEIFLGFTDGYLAQANNYFLYQIPENQQFVYIPHDFDSIMGISYFNPEKLLSGNYSDFPNLYKRPLMRELMSVPEFERQFNRILLHLALVVTPSAIGRIDNLANMITQDVEWDRSLPRVSTSAFSLKQRNPIDATDIAPVDGVIPSLVRDFVQWVSEKSVSFKVAVEGPTSHPSLFGIKEWLRLSSRTIKRFYLLKKRKHNRVSGIWGLTNGH